MKKNHFPVEDPTGELQDPKRFPAKFATQQQEISALSTQYDAIHGAGSAAKVIAQKKAAGACITMKSRILTLRGMLKSKTGSTAMAAAPAAAGRPSVTNVTRAAAPANPQIRPSAPVPAAPAAAPIASSVQKTLFYDEWRALSPDARGRFQVTGGQVVARTMTRSQFAKLSVPAATEYCKKGGKLIDG